MIVKNPKTLNDVQDAVFSNPAYQPTGDGVTFCNLATNSVLEALDYSGLHAMTADQMYAYVSTSKDWLIKTMIDAIDLVQEGTILLAILPASKLCQSHGHVNTLTPGLADFSGHWDSKTPLCMNLGRAGTCFRAKGVNWAFQVIPEIYALKETL